MVSVLPSSVVDCVFEPRSCQTKDYKIGICCLFAKHTALRRKNKDWLVRNQDNVWGDMSIRGPLFQPTSTIKIHSICYLLYWSLDYFIRITRRLSLVEQELLTLPKHLN
jgi:hypothetical protein